MRRIRSAVIGTVFAVPTILVACGETTTAPGGTATRLDAVAIGTWRAAIWQVSADGLTFKSARSGRLAQGVSSIIDSGVSIRLDSLELTNVRDEIEASALADQLHRSPVPSSSGGDSATFPSSAGSIRKPSLPGGQLMHLGVLEATGVDIEVQTADVADGRPPRSDIVRVGGRAVAVRRFRYRRTATSGSSRM